MLILTIYLKNVYFIFYFLKRLYNKNLCLGSGLKLVPCCRVMQMAKIFI